MRPSSSSSFTSPNTCSMPKRLTSHITGSSPKPWCGHHT
jgi:hypothetical protein